VIRVNSKELILKLGIIELKINNKYLQHGDKSAIVQAIQRLVEMDYLQNSPNKNKILYKRKDTPQSEFNFLSMMDNFESIRK